MYRIPAETETRKERSALEHILELYRLVVLNRLLELLDPQLLIGLVGGLQRIDADYLVVSRQMNYHKGEFERHWKLWKLGRSWVTVAHSEWPDRLSPHRRKRTNQVELAVSAQ